MSSLTKPALRGHLNRNIAKHLTIGIALGVVVGVIFKYTVSEPRKAKYAEFYKDYDPMVDFRRMRDLGLFQSAAPGESESL